MFGSDRCQQTIGDRTINGVCKKYAVVYIVFSFRQCLVLYVNCFQYFITKNIQTKNTDRTTPQNKIPNKQITDTKKPTIMDFRFVIKLL